MKTEGLFPKTELLEEAIKICIKKHRFQKRKGDGKPYYIHPVMVALKLAKFGFPEEVLAAALAHDIIEDTIKGEKSVRQRLGEGILQIVKTVTQNEHFEIKDKKERWKTKKKEYIESVRKGSDSSKAICVADKIHNLESFLLAYKKHGEKIWKRFNAGKEDKEWFENEVLKMLKETFDHPLTTEYENLLKKAENLYSKT